MDRIGQPWGFLGRPLGPLLTIGLPLMKNLLKLLAKNILISLGLAATDAVIQNKIYGSSITILIISNEKI